MRTEQDFESAVKAALQKECDGISASEDLKCRIDTTIRAEQEGNSMKHLHVKKICVIAAAACLLVSGITVLAGKVSYFVGVGSTELQYTKYSELPKAQEKLGYTVDSVEQFANGYSFAGAGMEKIEVHAEDNSKMYDIPAIDIRYLNWKDNKKIDLYVCDAAGKEVEEKEPDAVRTCNDVLLRYDEYTNKIVTAGYEPTQEDEENLKKDNFDLAYVSTTVKDSGTTGEDDDVKYSSYIISEQAGKAIGVKAAEGDDAYVVTSQYEEGQLWKIMTVTWEREGIAYKLTGCDLDMSAEEMLDMAQEIVESR